MRLHFRSMVRRAADVIGGQVGRRPAAAWPPPDRSAVRDVLAAVIAFRSTVADCATVANPGTSPRRSDFSPQGYPEEHQPTNDPPQ